MRIRTDNVFGTTTDAPLLVGATTLNSAGLANLAVVAGADRAVITLDPNRVNGAPEIIYVSAHTGAATSATILRGQEGTAAREHPVGTFWVHAWTAADPPFESYTVNSTNFTVGNGTITGRFMRVGSLVTFEMGLLFGSTTSFSGQPDFTLPVARAASVAFGVAPAWILDSGARNFLGVAVLGMDTAGNSSASRFLVQHSESGNAGTVNATNPMTWAVNDRLVVAGTYEAA